MDTYRNYIGSELVPAVQGGWIEVENPYTNRTFARVPAGGLQDVDKVVAAADAAHRSNWPKLPVEARAGYLRRFARMIREHRAELTYLLVTEQAKVHGLAQLEIDLAAACFDYYAGSAGNFTGDIVNSSSAAANGRSNESIWLNWKPIGVVAGLCPWNFPVLAMARKVAPAVLTGCPIIIKPSSLAPVTTLHFGQLVAETLPKLPRGVVNFVSGPGALLGAALTRHPAVQMVSLTGSVEVGVEVLRNAASKVMKTSLELGGKAPAIIFPDADLDLATRAVTDSRLIFAGQVCDGCERVYVHQSVYDEFVAKLTASFEAVRYGDPELDGMAYSSMIDKAQLDSINLAVELARAQGAKVVTGGAPVDLGRGYFFPPTLLTGVRQHSDIVQKEVFGPVLPVIPWSNYDEVISWANDSQYGLASSVFSTNVTTVLRAVKDLEFGETYVNREHFAALQGFHSGWRKSGRGGAGGKQGIYEYLQPQTVYLRH